MYAVVLTCELGLVLLGNFLISRDHAYGMMIAFAGLFVVPLFEQVR
jgi:hypothetical protein